MCGIAGIVHRDRAADPALLGRMLDALVHRGPDAEGRHVDGPVALGMRRLAVIDPVGGDQPLRSEDGRIVLVGNGELYDEPPLRAALRVRGHRFAGGSDLEVLVHLWEEHGPAALEHVRGMFAVALWDDRRRELFLARDRLGKKPLYWALHDGALRFGSEPRALLQDPAVPRDVDPRALDAFLANGYVPHGRSAFAALRRLGPGCALRWR
ncbi:asparagine synthetase B family protein, partial [Patulibacter sp. S7RM1-6]